MNETILGYALSAATITKMTVDALKIAFPGLKPYVVLLSVLVAGIGATFLLMLVDGVAFNQQQVATAILAGLMSAGTAIGVTELARSARQGSGETPAQPALTAHDVERAVGKMLTMAHAAEQYRDEQKLAEIGASRAIAAAFGKKDQQ